jgi:hypothetical protein
MMTKPSSLLIALLIAYVVAEFFILPWWMKCRYRNWKIFQPKLFDALPHTFALMVILAAAGLDRPSSYWLPVVFGLARFSSRFLSKIVSADKAVNFTLKNFVFLSLTIALWITYVGGWEHSPEYFSELVTFRRTLMILAYLSITRPAAAFIGPLLAAKIAEIGDVGTSLIGAGAMIGYLERGLIITFILLKHWDAIGFLLAAKGILRFNDLKPEDHRPITEYVMLGTLLSFSIAICVGSVTMYLLAFVPTHKADGKHDQLKLAAPVMVIFDPKQVGAGVDQPWKHLVTAT